MTPDLKFNAWRMNNPEIHAEMMAGFGGACIECGESDVTVLGVDVDVDDEGCDLKVIRCDRCAQDQGRLTTVLAEANARVDAGQHPLDAMVDAVNATATKGSA